MDIYNGEKYGLDRNLDSSENMSQSFKKQEY